MRCSCTSCSVSPLSFRLSLFFLFLCGSLYTRHEQFLRLLFCFLCAERCPPLLDLDAGHFHLPFSPSRWPAHAQSMLFPFDCCCASWSGGPACQCTFLLHACFAPPPPSLSAHRAVSTVRTVQFSAMQGARAMMTLCAVQPVFYLCNREFVNRQPHTSLYSVRHRNYLLPTECSTRQAHNEDGGRFAHRVSVHPSCSCTCSSGGADDRPPSLPFQPAERGEAPTQLWHARKRPRSSRIAGWRARAGEGRSSRGKAGDTREGGGKAQIGQGRRGESLFGRLSRQGPAAAAVARYVKAGHGRWIGEMRAAKLCLPASGNSHVGNGVCPQAHGRRSRCCVDRQPASQLTRLRPRPPLVSTSPCSPSSLLRATKERTIAAAAPHAKPR